MSDEQETVSVIAQLEERALVLRDLFFKESDIDHWPDPTLPGMSSREQQIARGDLVWFKKNAVQTAVLLDKVNALIDRLNERYDGDDPTADLEQITRDAEERAKQRTRGIRGKAPH